MFPKNSYFDQQSKLTLSGMGQLNSYAPPAPKETTISHEQLEDWAHRIGDAAYEAQDEKLMPLYSDLLDLRDEIVALLHDSLDQGRQLLLN